GYHGARGIRPPLRAHRVKVVAIGLRAAQAQFAMLFKVAKQRDVGPANRFAILSLPRQLRGVREQISGGDIFRDLLAERLARLRLLYGRAAALPTLPEFNRPQHQSGDHGQNDQNSEKRQQSGAAPSWGGGRPAEQSSQQAINEFLYSSGPTPYHRFALLLGLVFRTGEDVIKPRALILRCQVLSG